MGKVLMVLSLLIPLAVNLIYDSRAGLDPTEVQSHRVLVTGASAGIGEQVAYQYAKLGARLVITARREQVLVDVAKTCKELGAQEVHYIAADMADRLGPSQVVNFAQKHLGGLDQLILNHALLYRQWWTGNPENLTLLELMHRVNFFSYVQLASLAMPMLTACRGRIGVLTSCFGEMGAVGTSQYSSTKFALNGFFQSLRQELRHRETGVSVTFVQLGAVATEVFLKYNIEKYPVEAMLSPEEAASVVVENVSLRRYKMRSDWKFRALMFLNDIFPATIEDLISAVVVNDQTQWSVRLYYFLMSKLYSP